MVGTATIVKEDITTSGRRFGAVLTQVSKTYHQVSRPLLTADEIMRLKSPLKDVAISSSSPATCSFLLRARADLRHAKPLFSRSRVPRAGEAPVPATDSLHRSQVPAFQWDPKAGE